MEPRDIAVFVRVVEDGDFSTAARTPSLTPSAVSKLIARLEDQLGRRLLHRSSRAMRLTPEGQGFLDAVERALDAVEEAEAVGSAVPFRHASHPLRADLRALSTCAADAGLPAPPPQATDRVSTEQRTQRHFAGRRRGRRDR